MTLKQTICLILVLYITHVLAWKLPKNSIGNDRVVGGTKASDKYRMGTALIMYENEDGWNGACTGTIIGRKWVLTAAHCFDDSSSWWGVLPSSISATPSDSEAKKYGIYAKSIYIHKKWIDPNDSGFNFDIAVIELEDSIPWERYKKVKLINPPADNTVVKVVGYGDLSEDGETAETIMMADLRYRNFDFCWENFADGDTSYMSSHQFCAVSVTYPEDSTDSCYGDSGGPIYLVRKGNQPLQIGITSHGDGACGEDGGASWYVRARKFRRAIFKLTSKGKYSAFYRYTGDLQDD